MIARELVHSIAASLPAGFAARWIDAFHYFSAELSLDTGGWMYLDLNHGSFSDRPSQNWVVVSMHAGGRFSVDFDAAALGNGCSRSIPFPEEEIGRAHV